MDQREKQQTSPEMLICRLSERRPLQATVTNVVSLVSKPKLGEVVWGAGNEAGGGGLGGWE